MRPYELEVIGYYRSDGLFCRECVAKAYGVFPETLLSRGHSPTCDALGLEPMIRYGLEEFRRAARQTSLEDIERHHGKAEWQWSCGYAYYVFPDGLEIRESALRGDVPCKECGRDLEDMKPIPQPSGPLVGFIHAFANGGEAGSFLRTLAQIQQLQED